jgi:RimJ/RimL family protein N-acetyltransferase
MRGHAEETRADGVYANPSHDGEASESSRLTWRVETNFLVHGHREDDRRESSVQIYLETDRLLLRRFTQADVDNLVDLDSDPEVLRYINGGTPTPRDVIQHEILPRFVRYYDRYAGYGFWAAAERTSGEFLGWFGLHPDDEGEDRVALGYRLRRSAWGKGYATEGALALIRKGFAELGMRRVFATTYEHNVASRRVMEKVGMKLVRAYRPTPEQLASAGTYVATPGVIWEGNDVEYELERDDFERQVGALVPA